MSLVIFYKKKAKVCNPYTDSINMRTMELNGTITISRPVDSRVEEEYISISIKDVLGGCEVVQVKIPLGSFTKALTVQSGLACNIVCPSLELVGKKKELKTEFVPFDARSGTTKEKKREALKHFEVGGWKGYLEDLGNPHKLARVGGGVGYTVSFTRHVPISNNHSI